MAIVSDGSTDGTDEIIQDGAARYPWIRYVRCPAHAERHFAAKARAFSAGYAAVGTIPHDVVGNLDADLSFGPIPCSSSWAGSPRTTGSAWPACLSSNRPGRATTTGSRTSSMCREPASSSGVSALSDRRVQAHRGRRHRLAGRHDGTDDGLEDEDLHGKKSAHHRQIGTGQTNRLSALYRQGAKDFYLGNHPLWQLFRALYQTRNRRMG